MKRLVVTWRKGLLIASMALVLALALWTALTATHHQHRALEQADMAFEAVHMTARDPARLAAFYTQVFGMPTAPGRAGLALPGTVAPVVLQLPGYEGAGPVLTLAPVAGDTAAGRAARGPLPVYDRGYAHICFEADDVHRVVQAIQVQGGSVLSRFDDLAAAAVVYAADPEGNAIEVHIPLPEPVTPWTLARTAGQRPAHLLQAPCGRAGAFAFSACQPQRGGLAAHGGVLPAGRGRSAHRHRAQLPG